jgi:hypothetical protein
MIDKWELSDAGLAADGSELKTGSIVLPKYFVYAELYEFSVSTEEFVENFNTRIQTSTRVGFQIRMVSVENGEYLIASGLGSTTQTGLGFLATTQTGLGFLANPDMNFDQSTVGMSTQKALETATVTLIQRAKRRGWL